MSSIRRYRKGIKYYYDKGVGQKSMVDLIYEASYAAIPTKQQAALLASLDAFFTFQMIIKYWITLYRSIHPWFDLVRILTRIENGGSFSLLYGTMLDPYGGKQSIDRFLTEMAIMTVDHTDFNCDPVIAKLGEALGVNLKHVFNKKISIYMNDLREFLYLRKFTEIMACENVNDLLKACQEEPQSIL